MINLKQYVFLIHLELVGTTAQEQMKPRNENKKNNRLVIGELHISNCRSTVEIREYDLVGRLTLFVSLVSASDVGEYISPSQSPIN